MITDTEIKIKGLQILTESLGDVEAERFIALIQREPFDELRRSHKEWVEEYLGDGAKPRQEEWTGSIAADPQRLFEKKTKKCNN